MKKYIDMSFQFKIEGIYDILNQICRNVRKQCIQKDESGNINHNGSFKFRYKLLEEEIKKLNNPCITFCDTIHGELVHNYKINSDNWGLKHSLVKIIYGGIPIYIDITSEQLMDLNPLIPNIYISIYKPWYMLLDEDNIIYKNSILKNMNNKIKIMNVGIIEIFQYDIWGSISDILRWFYRYK